MRAALRQQSPHGLHGGLASNGAGLFGVGSKVRVGDGGAPGGRRKCVGAPAVRREASRQDTRIRRDEPTPRQLCGMADQLLVPIDGNNHGAAAIVGNE